MCNWYVQVFQLSVVHLGHIGSAAAWQKIAKTTFTISYVMFHNTVGSSRNVAFFFQKLVLEGIISHSSNFISSVSFLRGKLCPKHIKECDSQEIMLCGLFQNKTAFLQA